MNRLTRNMVLLLAIIGLMLVALVLPAFAAPLPPVYFDFDDVPEGAIAGGVAWPSYTKGGVTMDIAVVPQNGNHPGVVFNSSVPTGGDLDLGSPNTTCAISGPGVGVGGQVGATGVNCNSLGHVFIVNDDGIDDDGDGIVDNPPNDWVGNSLITFTFDQDVSVNYMDLLDIETTESMDITFLDSGDNPIGSMLSASGYGNNGYEELIINRTNVRKIVVDLNGSGSIASIVVTPVAEPPVAGLGDYVWADTNGNGIQDDGAARGINGVLVTLLDGQGSPTGMTTTTAAGPTGDPGYYEFTGLFPGSYIVQFSIPQVGGYTGYTLRDQGADDSKDSDADNNPVSPTYGQSPVVTLGPGEFNPTIDAGLLGGDPLSITLSSTDASSSAMLSISVLMVAAILGSATLLMLFSRRLSVQPNPVKN